MMIGLDSVHSETVFILKGNLLGDRVLQHHQIRVDFDQLEEIPHSGIDICNDIFSVSLDNGAGVFVP